MSKVKLTGIIFWLGTLVLFFQPVLTKFGATLGVLDEGVYLLFGMTCIMYGSKLTSYKGYSKFLLLFIVYAIFGLVSFYTYGHAKDPKQGFLQIFLDFKTVVFFSVFLIVPANKKFIKNFELCLKCIILLGIPFCMWQILIPHSYNAIFTSYAEQTSFQIAGLSLPRCTGAFWHPGIQAYFMSMAAMYFLYVSKNLKYFWLSIALLAVSFQRQEIATFLLLITLLMLYYSKKKTLKMTSIFIIFFGFVVVSLSFSYIYTYLSTVFGSLDLSGIDDSESARAVFYVDGAKLAYQQFPLGVGSGNFGGFAAQYFDSNVYHILGYDRFWWFKQGKYLTDTFYPHVFAEAGYIGFLIYCWCLYVIYKIYTRYIKDFYLRGAVFFMMAYMYIDCLTSPVLDSPFDLTLIGCILMILKYKDMNLILARDKELSLQHG